MPGSAMRSMLPLLALLWAATVQGAAAQADVTSSLPAHRVADPAAPAVTTDNLLASERFWPYHVALVEPWTPSGKQTSLPAGTRGVLIRVEPGGQARVDFGREGLHAVPIGKTDLLAQAERVRQGQLLKTAPNFALAIGSRLLDPGVTRAAPVDFARTSQRPGFLAVFADPGTPGFAELAKALAPLRGQAGVETILFPQGNQTDAQIADQLRSLDFRVPFVMGRLSEAYTQTLLPEGTLLPAVTLQTNEGRLLYLSRWNPEATPALATALAEALSASSR